MRSAPETVLLATRSQDKVREIRQILDGVAHARIITLHEAGIAPHPEEDDVESFDTFLDNAHAKAAFFCARARIPTLADDSGISVDALGGAPGVRSKRFALEAGLTGARLDQANNRRLLDEMRDVPDERRGARYTCAAVLHWPDGRRIAALGTCSGSILHEPRGAGGFGYDPLFRDPQSDRSFAELAPAEKNRRSHRARSFLALHAQL